MKSLIGHFLAAMLFGISTAAVLQPALQSGPGGTGFAYTGRPGAITTLGQEVANLIGGELEAGHHTVGFDAGNLPSGMYYYRLSAGATMITRKMVVLK